MVPSWLLHLLFKALAESKWVSTWEYWDVKTTGVSTVFSFDHSIWCHSWYFFQLSCLCKFRWVNFFHLLLESNCQVCVHQAVTPLTVSKVSYCFPDRSNTCNFFLSDVKTNPPNWAVKLASRSSNSTLAPIWLPNVASVRASNHTTIFNSWCGCHFVVSLDGFEQSSDKIKANFLCQSLTWDVVNIFTNSFEFWERNSYGYLQQSSPQKQIKAGFVNSSKVPDIESFPTDRWQTAESELSIDPRRAATGWLKTL